MAYNKSVIDINISFENESSASKAPPRPMVVRKIPKDKITLIKPSPESERTNRELIKRVQELKLFRKESQSADVSPLLVTALVKKTQDKLDSIKIGQLCELKLKPIEKFKWAARVVLVLVTSCIRWRRYRNPKGNKTELSNVHQRLTRSPKLHGAPRKSTGIGFEARSFKDPSKIDVELREILTCLPRARTKEQLKKVQRLLRKTRSFLIFPVERELDVARYVGYERYDNGRIIACQGRQPARFYYILSGRVSKMCVFDLAAGVTKMSFGDLMQGFTTDPVELQNGTMREHSLICKGAVEVLVLEREDFMDLLSCSPDNNAPIDYLRSVELFRSFPMDTFSQDKDAVMTKYFAKDAVIVKNCYENPYFYIVKSGLCKVVREQDVPDLGSGFKLPSINIPQKRRNSSNRGSPLNLLELSKAYSKDFSSRKTKMTINHGNLAKPSIHTSKLDEEETFITGSPEPGSKVKKDLRKAVEFRNDNDISLPKRPDNPLKKLSDLSVAIPTRKALLQIATLKPGDMFGLQPMMKKAARKISAGQGIKFSDEGKNVILISEGAECVMINKRFFLMKAGITTLVQLCALEEKYMSIEDAREKIQSQQAWNIYKREIMEHLAWNNKQRKEIARK